MRLIRDPDVLATLGPALFSSVRCDQPSLSIGGEATSDRLASDLASYPQMRGLLEHFVRRLPRRLMRLRDALAQQDGEALRHMALKIKQSASTHGYIPLALVAHRLVRRIDDTTSMDRLKDTVDELVALASRASAGPITSPDLPPRA